MDATGPRPLPVPASLVRAFPSGHFLAYLGTIFTHIRVQEVLRGTSTGVRYQFSNKIRSIQKNVFLGGNWKTELDELEASKIQAYQVCR